MDSLRRVTFLTPPWLCDRLRALVENLHKARNPLGLTPATNEFKFQQLRMELTTESELGKDEDEYQIIGLNQTLVSLGLWCVGLDALKYEAQLEAWRPKPPALALSDVPRLASM